jgi:hypothetical protein
MTERWILIVVGVWLIIAPWVLGFEGSVLVKWSSVLCGIIIVGMSFWNISERDEAASKPNIK